MSDPTERFSSVVVNPDDVFTVAPIGHSQAFTVDIEAVRRQLMEYNAARIKQTNLDKLITALAVCADHGLDLINEKQVALDKEPPTEDALHELAHEAGVTPAQFRRVWEVLGKKGGA